MILQDINKELLIYLNSLTSYEPIKIAVLCFGDIPIFFLPIFLISVWIYYTYKNNNKIISDLALTKNLLEKENLLYILYSVII
jgi:hypothetical protein